MSNTKINLLKEKESKVFKIWNETKDGIVLSPVTPIDL